jgi:hypothetical protein
MSLLKHKGRGSSTYLCHIVQMTQLLDNLSESYRHQTYVTFGFSRQVITVCIISRVLNLKFPICKSLTLAEIQIRITVNSL